MTIYTKADLAAMTVKDDLKPLASQLGITGYSKKPKDWIIKAILQAQKSDVKVSISQAKTTTVVPKAMLDKIQFQTTSILTKPNANRGDKCTTTLHISSGASSGQFPVVGRTVAEVAAFLAEVLNIEKMSIGHVNGKEVDGTYILKEGDNLEFLKSAGQKG